MNFGKKHLKVKKAYLKKSDLNMQQKSILGQMNIIPYNSSEKQNYCNCTERMTYKDWFEKWMNVYKKDTVKIGTYLCYLDYYRSIIGEQLDNVYIDEISGETIQKFYNSLAEKGYSLSTIKIISCIINSSLIQAERNKLIFENPTKNAYTPRTKGKEERMALTVSEQETFMKYAKKSYLYYFFCVMLRTGMRNGELRGLKWEDIDEINKVIHVRRTIKYDGISGYFEDTPKTKSSKREIPLTNDLLFILNEYVKTNNMDKIKNEFIFRNSRGNTLGRESVQNEIDKITRDINSDGIEFKRITPHVLRHTFATRAVEAGMQPQVLKNIMGHGSIAITMDIYSHVMPEVRHAEMEKISKAFI